MQDSVIPWKTVEKEEDEVEEQKKQRFSLFLSLPVVKLVELLHTLSCTIPHIYLFCLRVA